MTSLPAEITLPDGTKLTADDIVSLRKEREDLRVKAAKVDELEPTIKGLTEKANRGDRIDQLTRTIQQSTDFETSATACRELLLLQGMSPEAVDTEIERLRQANETPEPKRSGGKGRQVQDEDEGNEDTTMMQTITQLQKEIKELKSGQQGMFQEKFAQRLESATKEQLDNHPEIGKIVKTFARINSKDPDHATKAKAQLRVHIERVLEQRLEKRRQAGTLNIAAVAEEARNAANDVSASLGLVLGDVSALGAAPGSGIDLDALIKSVKRVPAPKVTDRTDTSDAQTQLSAHVRGEFEDMAARMGSQQV